MADVLDYDIDDHTSNTIIRDDHNRIAVEVQRDSLSGYFTLTIMPITDDED